jgi:hypothetical protein
MEDNPVMGRVTVKSQLGNVSPRIFCIDGSAEFLCVCYRNLRSSVPYGSCVPWHLHFVNFMRPDLFPVFVPYNKRPGFNKLFQQVLKGTACDNVLLVFCIRLQFRICRVFYFGEKYLYLILHVRRCQKFLFTADH